MILILVNTLNQKKKVKEKHKILLKDYFFDDINTRKYIRYEQERIVRKRCQK